jgi:hypothetical protein
MVENMSGSVRRMLDFIGESFDERCVNFEDNRRLPHTPSYAQVTEKFMTGLGSVIAITGSNWNRSSVSLNL